MRSLIEELRWVLEAGMNPYLLQPVTNMAKRRKSAIGKRLKKPRKAGRLKIARPRTRRKRSLTTPQRSIVKVQQARRRHDVEGMRFWNNKYAAYTQGP
jgi:hypothetical protein